MPRSNPIEQVFAYRQLPLHLSCPRDDLWRLFQFLLCDHRNEIRAEKVKTPEVDATDIFPRASTPRPVPLSSVANR
jgi:hypothetical protein